MQPAWFLAGQVLNDSLILPYISNTVHWINIILGRVDESDTMNDHIVDLHWIVQ